MRRRPGQPLAIAAVPVKDEVERIAPCLRALALQSERAPDAIVLVVNNSTDGTADAVRELLPVLPVPVRLIEHWFEPGQASAGAARRMALEHAATLLDDPADILLTTDADARVPPDWLAANLLHIDAGADAVAGRAILDPVDAALIPAKLHQDDAAECAYAAALDHLAALIDPEPWDPLPRHAEHSGASIAVTLDAYRRAGGMPAASLAEDRRFFAALRRVDARIRHAPEIEVVVSGRIEGRAEGGMADTIHRRLSAPDPYLDDALEPALDRLRRLELRRCFRRAWLAGSADEPLTASLHLDPTLLSEATRAPFFGAGWAMLEAASPALVRCLVHAADVQHELAVAEALTVERTLSPTSDFTS